MNEKNLIAKAEATYLEVGAWAREIVAKRVTITTAVVGIIAALVAVGVIPDKLGQQLDAGLAVGFTFLAAVVGALWARASVTPADPAKAPESTNGLPLVEQGGDSTSTATSDTMASGSDADAAWAALGVTDDTTADTATASPAAIGGENPTKPDPFMNGSGATPDSTQAVEASGEGQGDASGTVAFEAVQ